MLLRYGREVPESLLGICDCSGLTDIDPLSETSPDRWLSNPRDKVVGGFWEGGINLGGICLLSRCTDVIPFLVLLLPQLLGGGATGRKEVGTKKADASEEEQPG